MSKQTLSFEQYLASLPPERRSEVEKVWRVVRENMPGGYVEEIGPKFLTLLSRQMTIGMSHWLTRRITSACI